MLPSEAIKKFKDLYKKKFGEDLSDEDASRHANNLVNLIKVVYKPIPQTKESEEQVNKAYDILFEEVAKQKK